VKVSWDVCRGCHRAVAEDPRRILPRAPHRPVGVVGGSLTESSIKLGCAVDLIRAFPLRTMMRILARRH
jgi:hypothetical protein